MGVRPCDRSEMSNKVVLRQGHDGGRPIMICRARLEANFLCQLMHLGDT